MRFFAPPSLLRLCSASLSASPAKSSGAAHGEGVRQGQRDLVLPVTNERRKTESLILKSMSQTRLKGPFSCGSA